ncbi:hypothetical protein B0H12DRAFT_408195 [Mycena haematopus]|nr:hypothetical protein B0H12DRAFT_408195 [Mycena haematopus]
MEAYLSLSIVAFVLFIIIAGVCIDVVGVWRQLHFFLLYGKKSASDHRRCRKPEEKQNRNQYPPPS